MANIHLTTETLTRILQEQLNSAKRTRDLCEQENYSEYHVPGWDARILQIKEIARAMLVELDEEN